ncbi:MAG TPA: SagB family peptide dehydrogenase [Acidimicrobiales bacterium]|nr:SagB family peptide dehydrogenase [Acidimicrobiales bacterium]
MTAVGTRFRRSPHCLLQWDGADLLARNCDDQRLFRIGEGYVGILHRLSEWTAADDLAPPPGTDGARLRAALDRLVAMGLVVSDPPGESRPTATSWDPIDLAVQRRTSRGGYDASAPRPEPPPPPFKPVPGSPAIPLERSGLDDRVSLGAALDRRRTQRTYAPGGIGLGELGRFLHASARVTRTSTDPAAGALWHRPYPTAGARCELELYPLCNAVDGLEPGAYFYDPCNHALHLVRGRDAWQDEITRHARRSTGDATNLDPPVIVMVTAVFQRTMWKYRNIALSLILKDVGALYQTMYLVATALGLAPCALGGWTEEENARWLGLDPLDESQVGAFLLGRPAEDPAW